MDDKATLGLETPLPALWVRTIAVVLWRKAQPNRDSVNAIYQVGTSNDTTLRKTHSYSKARKDTGFAFAS